MDDAFADEGQKAIADLSKHIDGFGLRTVVVAFDVLGEVAVA